MSITELFEIIEYNNSIELENIIKTKKKLNLDISKKMYLIEKAILHRSKECFDILLNTNIILKNGIHISIKLLKDPNPTNRYYFDKLIEKIGDITDIDFNYGVNNIILYKILYENIIKYNVKFDYHTIMKYRNKEDFLTLFEKYYKNNFDILILLRSCVSAKNGFVHLIYERIEKDKPKYYCNEADIKYFNSIVLRNAIFASDLDMIKYIMEKPVFWTYVDNVPTLYISIYYSSNEIFNYFFDLYKTLSEEELNNIKNINTFKQLLRENSVYENFSETCIFRYKKIMSSFPIKFIKDDLIYILLSIVYCFMIFYDDVNNENTYIFIEYLLEYISITYPNTVYENISHEKIYKILINDHDITYNKLYALIDNKYSNDDKDLIVKSIMCTDIELPIYLVDYMKKLEYKNEYYKATRDNIHYTYSGTRYKNNFKDFIDKIKHIFKKYNFMIKELEIFI